MGSSEQELRAIAGDLGLQGSFLGTFDKHFPGFIQREKMSCAIVNTAARHTGGVHWLAFGWFPAKRAFYMFDPFGFSDKKLQQMYHFQYEGLMRRSAIASSPDRCVTLVRTDRAVQGPYSAACGLFCLLFLYAFTRYPEDPLDRNPVFGPLQGVPPEELMSLQAQPILFRNQEFLYSFLRARSPYFRLHENVIRRKTAFDRVKRQNANVM